MKVFITILLAIGIPCLGHAQQALNPVSNTGEQLIRDQAQKRLEAEQDRARKEAPAAGQNDDSPLPEPAPGEPAFLINDITVKNVKSLPPGNIEQVLARFRGTRFNGARLDRLISDLTNAYIKAGYITSRIYIAPQNLSQGRLELVAVEGRMEKLSFNENAFRDRTKRWMAFPAKPGDVIKLQRLEQGIDQVNRAPSADARITLDPGTQPGFSIVNITNPAKDALRGTISLDNHGNALTGELRLRSQLEADNILGLNDTWALTYLGTEESNAFVFNLGIPWRWWTFEVQGTYAESLLDVNPFAELLYYNYSGSATLSRVLHRSTHHKTTASVGFDYKNTERFINDVGLDPQPLGDFRASLSHLWRTQKTVATFTASLTQGVDWFEKDKKPQEPAAAGQTANEAQNDAGPESEFTLLAGTIALQHQATSWLSGQLFLQGQYGLSPLASTEQLYLTDYYTVRGFRDVSVSADYGVLGRFELAAKPFSKWEKASGWQGAAGGFSLFSFCDAGWAGSHDVEKQVTAASLGGGLRWTWKRLSSELYAARPVSYPKGTDPGWEAFFTCSLKCF